MKEVTTRVKIQHKMSNDRWCPSTTNLVYLLPNLRLDCSKLAYISTQEQIYAATLASNIAMLNIPDSAVFRALHLNCSTTFFLSRLPKWTTLLLVSSASHDYNSLATVLEYRLREIRWVVEQQQQRLRLCSTCRVALSLLLVSISICST